MVVLHDNNLAARYADQLAVLRQGRLFANGAPQAILSPRLFAEVYGVQAWIERCSRDTVQVMVNHAL